MKKTYIKPTLEALNMGTQQILALSFSGSNGNATLNDEYADSDEVL